MKNKADQQKGFTLIEMILAFSILSVVLLSLYGAFWSGIEIQKRSEKAQTLIRQNVWTLDAMAKELESMISYDFSKSEPEALAFTADALHVSFFLASEDGLKHIEYFLEKEEDVFIHRVEVKETLDENVSVVQEKQTSLDRYALVRSEESLESFLKGSVQEPEKEILLKGLLADGLGFSFAFLEKQSEQSVQIVWKDQWPENYIPPEL